MYHASMVMSSAPSGYINVGFIGEMMKDAGKTAPVVKRTCAKRASSSVMFGDMMPARIYKTKKRWVLFLGGGGKPSTSVAMRLTHDDVASCLHVHTDRVADAISPFRSKKMDVRAVMEPPSPPTWLNRHPLTGWVRTRQPGFLLYPHTADGITLLYSPFCKYR